MHVASDKVQVIRIRLARINTGQSIRQAASLSLEQLAVIAQLRLQLFDGRFLLFNLVLKRDNLLGLLIDLFL